MTQFITKNKKVVPISVRKMSDSQLEKIIKEGNAKLNKIEAKHGEAYILKDKKLDALAEKVAQARVTQRDRAFQKLQDEHEADTKVFAEKNPEVAVLTKLRKDPMFKLSDDHTYGWKDSKVDLPTYIPAKVVPNDPNDFTENHITKFKGEGSESISVADSARVSSIQANAFKDKLITRKNNAEIFLNKAKIFVSPNPDRPIVFQLESRSYILAPRVTSEVD